MVGVVVLFSNTFIVSWVGFTDWCNEEYSYKQLYELEKLLEDEKINIEIKWGDWHEK